MAPYPPRWRIFLLLHLTVATAFHHHILTRRPLKRPHVSLSSSEEECILPADLIPTANLIELLQYCSITDRGQSATEGQRERIKILLSDILASEEENFDFSMLDGVWKLVYASEALYRSSPFFWAFRKLCRGMTSPVLDAEFSEAVFAITDGIPFKSVGQVKQTLSDTPSRYGVGSLKSEVTLSISLFDALVPRGQSVMTTTAETRNPNVDSGTKESRQTLDLTVLTTEVKESSIAKVPGFDFVNDAKFPTRDVFDALASSGLLPVNGKGGGVGGLLERFAGGLRDMTSEPGSAPEEIGEEQPTAAVVAMDNALFAAGSMRVAYAPDGNFFVWSRMGPTPKTSAPPSSAVENAAYNRGVGVEDEVSNNDEWERVGPGDFAEFEDGMPDS